MEALVDTGWLAREIGSKGKEPLATLRVVDARFYLDPARQGLDAWRAATSPARSFSTWTRTSPRRAAAAGSRSAAIRGRRPKQVARVMSASGIGTGVRVVATTTSAGGTAARLWYLLRAHGHDEVAVLDGGIAKWTARAGRTEPRRLAASRPLRGTPRRALWSPRRDVAGRCRAPRPRCARPRALPRRRRARRPARRPHPGRDERPLPGEPHRPRRRRASVRRRSCGCSTSRSGRRHASAVVYCGSGVTACHDLLALELAGLRGTALRGLLERVVVRPRAAGCDRRRVSRSST